MKSRSRDTLSDTESLVVLPNASEISPAVFLSCREQTLTVHVNGVPFVRVACSGQHLRYLVPGFLYSCGVINSLHDLAGVDSRREAREATSGEARGPEATPESQFVRSC